MVRYVGVTTLNPVHRLAGHLRGDTPSTTKWLQSVLQPPEIRILEECTPTKAGNREQYWIAFYREHNHPLLNISRGGLRQSGYKLSPETRERMSRAHRGKPKSVKTRKRMSEAKKGFSWGSHTEETRRQMSIHRKGRTRGSRNGIPISS